MKEQANNLIDFKDSNSFKNNLIILENIEIFYENLLYAQSHSGEIKQTELDKYEISKLISENLIKAEDGDANALLSLYLKAIKKKKHIDNYGPFEETIGFRKIIAPGRLAQIPLDSESDVGFKISSIKYKEDIVDLDKKQKEIFKQIKDLQDLYKKEFNYDLAFKSDADSRLYFLKNNKKNIKSDTLEEEILVLKQIVKLEKQENNLFQQNLYKLENFDLKDFFKNNVNDYENLSGFLVNIWSNDTLSNEIKDSLGVSVTDFSITEQAYILDFLKNAKNKDLPTIKEFSKKYKENGFRTFLSIEHGGQDMGDKILTLSQKLPEDLAKKLFSKYSEYIDSVNTVEDFIKENFAKFGEFSDLIPKTKEAMFVRGYELLRSQAEKIEKNEFNEDKFNLVIEKAKTNVDMFKNIFRVAREHDRDTSFEDFANLNPQEIDSSELNKEDEIQIKEIIKKNYDNPELQNQVLESFKNALKNGTKLNLLRRNEKIIATSRLDTKDKDTLYFGSFNVDSDYCGSKIGDAFFQATIMPHMKDKTIEADCSTIQPIGAYYIEAGFVGESFYSKGGEPSMSIVSKPNTYFDSKNLSREELLNLKENGAIKVFSGKSQQDLPVEMFDQGKKLTRYFYEKNTKLWYFVFE